MPRSEVEWVLEAVRQGEPPAEPTTGAAADVLEVLRSRGACFRSDLAAAARRLPAEVDLGLWDLVARGIVTADAFSAVRSLTGASPRGRAPRRPAVGASLRLARRRAGVGTGTGEGRWSLLVAPSVDGEPAKEDAETVPSTRPGTAARGGGAVDPVAAEDLAEAVATQLLLRWGVVCWELWARESFKVPWRDVVRALRRFEARGQALGGRFVAGLSGEQYALAEAADLLRAERGRSTGESTVQVAGADPLNLTGLVLPGPRVPAARHRLVRLRGGQVVADDGATAPEPVGGMAG